MVRQLFRPYHARMRQVLRRAEPDFFASAVESWQESPPDNHLLRPARFLPGQLERIRASMFASLPEVLSILTQDGEVSEMATTGWRFRDVDLVDGVLYGTQGEVHLRRRQRRFGLAFRPRRALSGVLSETWVTNRWFGSWLMEELVTWPLAVARGRALSTAAAPAPGSHATRYLELLDIRPERIAEDVHFDELILFDDLASNADKRRRQQAMRAKLLAGRQPAPVPGVFLLRGRTGDLRFLRNEHELAGRLAAERGFLVLDPMTTTVDALIEACGAARCIVGVEGSHLVHGIVAAPAGAAIVPIQPPDRVAATLKGLSDRLDQQFGLVVGEGSDADFTLNWRDLAATLDLFD